MPQYSQTTEQPNGSVVNAVLDTESNQITYTVTARTGQIATVTQSADSKTVPTAALIAQLREAGVTGGISIGAALSNVTENVNRESRDAARAATATNTPVPDNPQPPPPVPKEENPNPVPPSQEAQSQNASPPTSNPPTVSGPTGTPYDDDGNLNIGWGLDESGNPVWVGEGYIDATGTKSPAYAEPPTVSGPTGTPYDDDGNLNIGWGLDEDGNPVWVGEGYIDATGTKSPAYAEPPTVSGPTGTPYDDDGNLNPGWSLDEDGNPVWVGNNSDGTVFVEPATKASAQQSFSSAKGLTAAKTNTKTQATQQDQANFKLTEDWRVRLSLAPKAEYLYKAPNPGILAPLSTTNGILFPYTPSISVQYAASYDAAEITHSNYKLYQYKGSSVDNISITCEFTAQDTFEANYLLAVIHFLRSVTKMFYGKDENPKKGTPPPLCYLTGLGAYQFDSHPLAITNFTYNLPTDVDYIRAGTTTTNAGVDKSPEASPNNSDQTKRLTGIAPGGTAPPPNYSTVPGGTIEPTYVPTKMQIQISAIPIITRNDISNNFSLKEYATGALLRGMSGNKKISGGIW